MKNKSGQERFFLITILIAVIALFGTLLLGSKNSTVIVIISTVVLSIGGLAFLANHSKSSVIQKISRLVSLMVCLLVVGGILISGTLPNIQASVTGSFPDYLIAENSTGAWTINGDTLSITVQSTKDDGCGGGYTTQTESITLKNNNVSDDYYLILSGTITNSGTVIIDNEKYDGAEKSFRLLKNGANSVNIQVTSKPNGSDRCDLTLTFSYVKVEPAEVIVKFDSSLGSVMLGGQPVKNNDVLQSNGDSAMAFSAKPNNGAVFLGWIDENQKIVSKNTECQLEVVKDMTIKAVFASSQTTAWFLVDDGRYLTNDLNTACSIGTKVILAASGVLPAGDYTIPTGVTLVVPCDENGVPMLASPTIQNSYSTPTVYRTMVMAPGANITVNGAMSIAGSVSEKMGSNGQPTGAVGFVRMNSDSSIIVNNGATLYAWGYVMGSGSVVIESGGTVYECFQAEDYRGGSATSDMAGGGKNEVFPMSQYYIQNIEVPMTMKAGSKEYCFFAANVSSMTQTATIPFIGSNAMFNITSGCLVKDYDESTDRLIVDVYGDFSVSPYSFKVAVTIDTNNFVLPLTPNLTVNINSGTMTLSQDIALLPEAQVNIAEGANCILTQGVRLIVYDIDNWGAYCGSKNARMVPLNYAPGRQTGVSRTDLSKNASLLVNGILDASKGYIYTTAGGANIYSTSSGKIIANSAGKESKTYQVTQTAEQGLLGTTQKVSTNEIPITPAKLKNADGTYAQTANCKTASASKPLVMTYTNGKWVCDSDSHTYNVVASSVIQATCSQEGSATYKCAVCGDEKIETTPTEPHDFEGFEWDDTDHWNNCQMCGEINREPHYDSDDEDRKCDTCGYSMACKKHTEATKEEVIEAATCAKIGSYDLVTYCTTCNEEIDRQRKQIPTISHTMELVPAKEPTCTEEGYIQHWLCSVCNHKFAKQADTTWLEDKDIVESMLPHSYTEELSRTPATCMASGTLVMKCATCEATETTPLQIDANAHTGNNHTSDAKPASCYEEGYTGDTVCECGVTVATGQAIPKSNHALQHYEASDATCTEDGNREFYCCENYAQCGGVFFDADGKQPVTDESQVIIPAAHKPGEDDGDCTTAIECTVCGTETTPANEKHTPGDDDGDCTTAVKCVNCDQIATEAKAHDFSGEWEKNENGHWLVCKNSGCTQTEGNAEHSFGEWQKDENNHWKECACGEKSEFAAHDHDENGDCVCSHDCVHTSSTLTPANDATCIEPGNTAYYTCDDCGKFFSDAECTSAIEKDSWVIAPGHDYNTEEWVPVPGTDKHGNQCQNCEDIGNQADCSGGTATCKDKAVCEICGQSYGVYANCVDEDNDNSCDICTNPICEHTDKLYVEAKDATCTEKGNLEHWICQSETCGRYYLDEECTMLTTAEGVVVDEKEHDYSEDLCDREFAWKKCSACTATTERVARKYTVTVIDYLGNETVKYDLVYNAVLDLEHSASEESMIFSWVVDGQPVSAEQVWEAFEIDAKTVLLTVKEAAYKPGKIQMAVDYTGADSEKTMTVDLFISVESLAEAQKPIVKLGGKTLELKQIHESIMMYFVSIQFSAKEITQGGDNTKIEINYVYYNGDDTVDKTINSILIAYEVALSNYIGDDKADATKQETAIEAVLNYGKAVQIYFAEGNYNWAYQAYDDTVINSLANSQTPDRESVQVGDIKFTWVGANVQFKEAYSLRYEFEMTGLPNGVTPASAKIVVTDKNGTLLGEYTDPTIDVKRDTTHHFYAMYPVPASDIAKEDTVVKMVITLSDGTTVIETPEFKYGMRAYLTNSIHHFTKEIDPATGKVYTVGGETNQDTREKTNQYVQMLASLLKLGETMIELESAS